MPTINSSMSKREAFSVIPASNQKISETLANHFCPDIQHFPSTAPFS